MIKVNFYDSVEDSLIKFAVIVSKYNGKWVFCKHKSRNTLECPGGHREKGETVLEAAKRELYEETGAKQYILTPVCVYSVIKSADTNTAEESFGMLYYAEITGLGELPHLEIERIELLDTLPHNWTYPEIQPLLLKKASQAEQGSC